MGILSRPAAGAFVALAFGYLACSGEDEEGGKSIGAVAAAGSAGAAGSGTLAIGGRAGAGAAGAEPGGSAGAGGPSPGGNAGAAGAEAGGNAGASGSCLPALPAPAPTACDGSAPKNLAFLALDPMPVAVPLPTALVLPGKPNVFVVRGRGSAGPLVVGKIDGGKVTWVATSSDAAEQISGAGIVGDDLWITSSYTPHRLWRCAIGDDLAATCEAKGDFPHGHANGTLFGIPPSSCDHPAGALLDIDSPADGTPQDQPHDAHLYDIATGVWTNVKRPTGERRDLSRIIRLRDGRVLFVGGDDANEQAQATTEIFDGKSITAGPKLNHGRFGQGMGLFPDGRVLVTGGYGRDSSFPPWEIIDPVAGTVTLSPQPETDKTGRGFAPTTGLLGTCGYVSLGGRVPGDGAPLDYFPFASPGFQRLTAPALPAPIEYGASIPLPDGSLVYVGGRDPGTNGSPQGPWLPTAFRLF